MLRLSDSEKAIIAAAQLDADVTPNSIAKQLKLQVHSVRYTLSKMLDVGLINRLTCVNLARLGLVEYYFVVKLKSKTTTSIKKMVDILRKSDHVVWILELGGDYHLGVVFLAKSIKDATLFAEQVMERSKVEAKQHNICIRVSRTYFGVKYLGNVEKFEPVNLGNLTITETEWDEYDHEILKAMASNTENESRSIAKLLGKPEATVHYRMKQLMAKGILSRQVYMVDTTKLGMLHYRIHLQTSSPSADLRNGLYTWGLNHKNVLACFHCIGPWDFEYRVEVSEPQQAMEISRELGDKFGDDLANIEVIPCVSLSTLRHYPFQRMPTEGCFFL